MSTLLYAGYSVTAKKRNLQIAWVKPLIFIIYNSLCDILLYLSNISLVEVVNLFKITQRKRFYFYFLVIIQFSNVTWRDVSRVSSFIDDIVMNRHYQSSLRTMTSSHCSNIYVYLIQSFRIFVLIFKHNYCLLMVSVIPSR